MQGIAEALGFHIGADMHQYQGRATDEHNYIDQVEKDLKSQANLEAAMNYRNLNSIRKWENGKARYLSCCCSSTRHFSKYSIGFQLHFLLIKQLIVVFFIIAGVSILPLYVNYTGEYYTQAMVQSELDFFSLGNEYGIRINSTDVLDTSQLEHDYFMIWVTDGACSGFFLLMLVIFFVHGFISIRKAIISIHKVSEYAIEVKGLPRLGVDKNEIKDHFSKFGEVCEVYLGRRYYNLLYYYTERASILQEIKVQESLLKFKGVDLDKDKKYRKLNKKLFQWDSKILKSKSIKSHDQLEIKRAYIVFDKKQDKINCIKQYEKRRCCGCSCQKERLRFRGIYKLQAFQASEPSDIIWENLEVGKFSRFVRFIFSLLLTLLVLLASIAMIYYVKTAQSKIPNDSQCSTVDITQPGDSDSSLQTLCYCENLSQKKLIDKSTSTCSVYLQDLSYAWSMKFLSSFGIILMNFFLKVLMRKISSFERPVSKSQIQNKIFKKVFILMFFNTAILTYLVNLSIPSLSQYILGGNYNDFTRDWYLHVGNLIMTLMIISLGSPHLIILSIVYPLGFIKRRCCFKSKKSQYELNMLFLGPEFDIATRSSQILNIVSTCYLYSGGLPLLNCICFVFLVIIYYTDRCLVLRHCKSPPYYNQDLYLTALKLLPVAIMMHCGVTLYMYGNTEIFPLSFPENTTIRAIFGDNIAPRIERPSGIYNCLLIVGGIFVLMLLNFLDAVCNCCLKKLIINSATAATFTDIREALQTTGLHSYDIRQNPEYAMIINAMDESLMLEEGLSKRSYFDTSRVKTATLRNSGIDLSPTPLNIEREEENLPNGGPFVSDSESSQPEFSRDGSSPIIVRLSGDYQYDNEESYHEHISLRQQEEEEDKHYPDCPSDRSISEEREEKEMPHEEDKTGVPEVKNNENINEALQPEKKKKKKKKKHHKRHSSNSD